jgi:ABC-type bacteriocin/lantibiotic exporter with double-glycine peptidase domain
MPPPPERDGAGVPGAGTSPALRASFRHFGRILRLIRPYWGLFGRSVGMSLAVTLLGLVTPYLSKLMFDEVYPTRDVTLLHVLVAGSLALAVTSVLISGTENYFRLFLSTRLNAALGLLFFNHLMHLRLRFYEERRVGEVLSRFGDIQQALQSVSSTVQTVLLQGIILVVVPPFLFLLQWKLALVAIVGIPLTAAVIGATGRLLRRGWKRSAEAYAELSALQVESMNQVRLIKSSALEPHLFRQTQRLTETAAGEALRAGGLGQLITTFNASLTALTTALFTVVGWRLILAGEMSLGDYVAFTAYIGYLYGPATRFVGLFSEFQHSAVSFFRIFEYLDVEPEHDPTASYQLPPPPRHVVRGALELREVSFGYTPGTWALDRVSLEIPAGTRLAVVGPSGSGKTTLLRLLTRMDDPQEGAVLVDGVPTGSIPHGELRRQVAVVWQDYGMLKGTIRENLTVGLGEVDPERVRQAARVARIDDFIRTLPDGYDTSMAEWGASFSSGQRQRMAIARALVRDAPVLLLDEVTANIDVETEAELVRELFASQAGRTVVFVTHRVATALHADRICVMEGGRVAGLGTHAELLAECAVYRRLWQAASPELPLAEVDTLIGADTADPLRVVRLSP